MMTTGTTPIRLGLGERDLHGYCGTRAQLKDELHAGCLVVEKGGGYSLFCFQRIFSPSRHR